MNLENKIITENNNENKKENNERENQENKSEIINIFEKNYKCTIFIVKISSFYLFWIILHYIASHIYAEICVPKTLYGFLISPFIISTPHCRGLRWLIINSTMVIENMWVLLGTWMTTSVLITH